GDFDYSGAVDGTDYAMLDSGYNFQGSPLSAGAPQALAMVVGAGAPGNMSGAASGALKTPSVTSESPVAPAGGLMLVEPSSNMLVGTSPTLPPVTPSREAAIDAALRQGFAQLPTGDDPLYDLLAENLAGPRPKRGGK